MQTVNAALISEAERFNILQQLRAASDLNPVNCVRRKEETETLTEQKINESDVCKEE